ncbi:MAG TPA: CGNR zinc finger domain-containing protein [Streptosporangiaceae bacterium]|jgi:predicted RNA-binding Zn ribbon-like protein
MSTNYASQRYGTSIAPDGLRLTQELANTRGVAKSPQGQDLLGDTVTAQAWLDTQLAGWAERHGGPAPRIELTGRSLRQLQQLRDRVRALLRGGADAEAGMPVTAVDLTVTADGSALAPRGDGLAWLTSAVAIELHLAGLAGQRHRLKVCRNERCGVAFHDQSKNNSRTWHDVSTCGNKANVQAYRQRQREAATRS